MKSAFFIDDLLKTQVAPPGTAYHIGPLLEQILGSSGISLHCNVLYCPSLWMHQCVRLNLI